METYDLIIVGAGPAGLTLAERLSNSNLKILLLDKKKGTEDVQYNTSGSFIDPNDWGLPVSILNPIHECHISSKGQSTIKKGQAFVIDRKKLLKFLETKAQKNPNLEICYNSIVKKIKIEENNIVSINYSNNKKDFKVSGKIYADCSGTSVLLGRKIELFPNSTIAVGAEYIVPLKKYPHTTDLFFESELKGGYGAIFPKDQKTAIIGYYTLSKDCFPKVENYLKNMWKMGRVRERCEFSPIEKHIGVLRTGKPLHRFVKNNLVLIGDTALQANPLVGEGIRFVMDSSRIASRWIKESIEKDDLNLLKNYEREWKRKYYRKFKIAFLLQQKMKKYTQNDNKIDFVVKKLDKISDKDFVKLLKGDIGYLFLFKLAIKFFIKN